MKYFIDTEFHERPNTITLISLAIVAEDGREFYKWNCHCESARQDLWLKENVFPHAPPEWITIGNLTYRHHSSVGWLPSQAFKEEILQFIGEDKAPEFWGYYADYDWVVFCWQFGRMIDLPKNFPMYCRDIKQEADRLGIDKIPIPDMGHHNALWDARWAKSAYDFLTSNAPARPVPPLRSAVQNAEEAAKTAANSASPQ